MKPRLRERSRSLLVSIMDNPNTSHRLLHDGSTGRVLSLLGAALLAHLIHLSSTVESNGSDATPLAVVDASVSGVLALGHETSLADLYWLELVQYVGANDSTAMQWPLLEALAEKVIRVDPMYGYAYEASGVLLAQAGRTDSSNEILLRGMEHIPERWQLPFFAAFNYWHSMDELDRGADLLLRASKLPGSPRYLASLATRLYSSSGNLDEGLNLLEGALALPLDPLMRTELEKRREDLLVERVLQQTEAKISQYRAKNERPPLSLAELDDPELRAILSSEIGRTIVFDPTLGEVSSPLLPERLLVYRPSDVPEALAAP